MTAPYDSVISIGGQSFVDGIWRLLGPGLQGLTNPLPLALPGFANASMRITQLVPVFPGVPPSGGALNLLATIELNAEALLEVAAFTDTITLMLGPHQLRLRDIAGTMGLPLVNGNLRNIAISGSSPLGALDLTSGTGSFDVPAGPRALTDGTLDAMLELPGGLTLPGLPLPTVVPVAVDLTPSAPLVVGASLVLAVAGITPMTRFGLLFNVSEVVVGPVALDPAVRTNFQSRLQDMVDAISRRLGLPATTTTPQVADATVTALLNPIPAIVNAAFDDALSRLLAETGRLVYPPAGTGASCEVMALPTGGDARLSVASDGTYVLQVGLNRSGTGDIPAFPTFEPMGAVDSNLLVGNTFLLELLCCLVERLPAFTMPSAPTTSTTDVATPAATHTACCNFTGVTLDLGLVALTGGVSVCLDGASGSTKTFSIVGAFAQASGFADIRVNFTLPIAFDLDDAAALANLRPTGTPTVSVGVNPNAGLVAGLALTSFFLVGPAIGAATVILLFAVCGLANVLLTNAVNMVLRHASMLRSPVAVPPGLFEAFGKFSPVTVRVDDLTADGVMHTPTSPWALLPRIGIGGRRPRNPDTDERLTHRGQPAAAGGANAA